MLTVDRVTKRYGSFTALEDISLQFDNGIHALLAPNGAGKTTLINMMTTLLKPTSGEIRYDGVNIKQLDASYREVLGFLPQEFGYYKNQSPRQFLAYISALKGLEKNMARRKADALIGQVGLSGVADKKMKAFSGGMVQRVGIAQAMLNDPKILILDEPTAGLDPKERARFRNLISELSKNRVVILSTHIVSDIESIANRVIMFKSHSLLYDDSPANICAKLDGMVYEAKLDDIGGHTHEMLTQRQQDGQTVIRFYNDQTIEGSRRVSPSLEDVFLHIYANDEAIS